jgi:hypothetical protein
MHCAHPIFRRHVRSSVVRSVGYDETDWVLQVEFNGGKVCNFFRVPPEEFAKLMKAASVGAYVRREVKPYYEYEEEDGLDE